MEVKDIEEVKQIKELSRREGRGAWQFFGHFK
jgi:hypothetical protein